MVRAPCCEKMGLKRGPWTTDEDRILINYINLYGHGNWRALPKQAGKIPNYLPGLLRCGKSCRLRWTNYLRPDIKRGNFSTEEEETIIELHEKLGNRWSAIAARLPGRTDNEIKNVWHTHLKKRLDQNKTNPETKQPKSKSKTIKMRTKNHQAPEKESEPINHPNQTRIQSPENSSSEISAAAASSSSDTAATATTRTKANISDDFFAGAEDNFWSDVFSAERSSVTSDFPADPQVQFQFSPLYATENVHGFQDGMDFLFNNLFTTAAELPDFLDLQH